MPLCLAMPYRRRAGREIDALLVRLYASAAVERPAARTEEDGKAAGDRAATLFDLHGDAILRLAYSYLHNMADAEDILQDTLIQYLRTAPRLESPAHEKAWLLRVAANLSKNKIDRNRVRQADALEESLIAGDREDLAFVWEAVRQLPENYRAVIHLYYQEGYATREIAQILGRRESTVRSDLRRGRSRLKAILKEAYDFDALS